MRSTRTSRCSSPIPEISVWPVSSFVWTWNVGSSSASRPSATDIFSWSDFVFGSTATLITGSGNSMVSRLIGASGAASVSPVTTCLMPTPAAMSPAWTSETSSRSFACIIRIRPMRSVRPLDTLRMREPASSRPEYTRKYVSLPTNGSAMILKARAANGAPSSAGRVSWRGSSWPLTSTRPGAGGAAHGLGRGSGARRDVERARQVVEARVEQRLDALVLERRAAEDGRQLDVERRLADRLLEALDRDLLLLEDRLDELVVVVGDLLEQVLAGGVGEVAVLVRDVDDVELLAELVLVHDRLHPDKIDDPAELALRADRQLHRHGVRAEAVDHRLHGLVEVRADAVHLVDERDARDAVLVGLAPDRLGLRLDAGDRVEQRDGAVEHAQRPLDLDREVDVAGRVDDVDPVVAPLAGRGRGRDRDAALLLLLHPVHRRGALVDLTDLVGASRVIEDALRRRRLAGVDVRHDPDVAGLFERKLAGHVKAGGVGESGQKERAPRARTHDSSVMLPAALCARGLHPAQ